MRNHKSFASPERMDRCIGVVPGSVCAFGLINDIDIADSANPKELFENGHRVKYFLDRELQSAEKVSFHPCDNTASVVLTHEYVYEVPLHLGRGVRMA